MNGLCGGMAWKRKSREQPALPALPSRVDLRTVFLGEKRLSKKKVFLVV